MVEDALECIAGDLARSAAQLAAHGGEQVQREVGERLAAGVGDDAYGAVSVKV